MVGLRRAQEPSEGSCCHMLIPEHGASSSTFSSHSRLEERAQTEDRTAVLPPSVSVFLFSHRHSLFPFIPSFSSLSLSPSLSPPFPVPSQLSLPLPLPPSLFSEGGLLF